MLNHSDVFTKFLDEKSFWFHLEAMGFHRMHGRAKNAKELLEGEISVDERNLCDRSNVQ